MKHKNLFALIVNFILFVYSYSEVDFVKASIVTTEKDLTDETYYKLPLRNRATSTIVEGTSNCGSSIHGQKVCAGDATIPTNRDQFLEILYLNSSIHKLVNLAHEWNRSIRLFTAPFSLRLWITIMCSWIFTGVGIAIIEKRALLQERAGNKNIANPLNQKRRMGKRHKRRNQLIKS